MGGSGRAEEQVGHDDQEELLCIGRTRPVVGNRSRNPVEAGRDRAGRRTPGTVHAHGGSWLGASVQQGNHRLLPMKSSTKRRRIVRRPAIDSPVSCIESRPVHRFTAQNTGFPGRSSVWFKFTASEDKPHALIVVLARHSPSSPRKRGESGNPLQSRKSLDSRFRGNDGLFAKPASGSTERNNGPLFMQQSHFVMSDSWERRRLARFAMWRAFGPLRAGRPRSQVHDGRLVPAIPGWGTEDGIGRSSNRGSLPSNLVGNSLPIEAETGKHA